jgi:RimJ/RimL family protein N-acetyltransferase
MSIRLRPATLADARTVFTWRNDPWIVSLSASRATVGWEEHIAWYERVIHGDHLLHIIESDEGAGMGCVRLDRSGAEAVVTIYLLRPFVGKGIGVLALRQSCAEAFAHWPALRRIRALIRPDNVPSLRAFAKAGFVNEKCGPTAKEQVEMVLHSPDQRTAVA